MTPAERIAAALQAANNPSAFHAGLPPSAVERRTARIVIDALCPKGERVVLDRTGDTDLYDIRQRVFARKMGPVLQDDSEFVSFGPGEPCAWADIEDGHDE